MLTSQYGYCGIYDQGEPRQTQGHESRSRILVALVTSFRKTHVWL